MWENKDAIESFEFLHSRTHAGSVDWWYRDPRSQRGTPDINLLSSSDFCSHTGYDIDLGQERIVLVVTWDARQSIGVQPSSIDDCVLAAHKAAAQLVGIDFKPLGDEMSGCYGLVGYVLPSPSIVKETDPSLPWTVVKVATLSPSSPKGEQAQVVTTASFDSQATAAQELSAVVSAVLRHVNLDDHTPMRMTATADYHLARYVLQHLVPYLTHAQK